MGTRTPLIMSAPPTAPPSPTLITQTLHEDPLDEIYIIEHTHLSAVPSSTVSSRPASRPPSPRGRRSRANSTSIRDGDRTPEGDGSTEGHASTEHHEEHHSQRPQRPNYLAATRATSSRSSGPRTEGHDRPKSRPSSANTPLSDEPSPWQSNDGYRRSSSYFSHQVQTASPPGGSPDGFAPINLVPSNDNTASPPVPPSTSTSSHQPRTSASTSRERHSARFSLTSTVSHILKDVRHEVKEAVRGASSKRSMSRLRGEDAAASGSRARESGSTARDEQNAERTARGRNSLVMPLGGETAQDEDQLPGETKERSKSRSKSKSRFPDFHLEMSGGVEHWKEFRGGMLFLSI